MLVRFPHHINCNTKHKLLNSIIYRITQIKQNLNFKLSPKSTHSITIMYENRNWNKPNIKFSRNLWTKQTAFIALKQTILFDKNLLHSLRIIHTWKYSLNGVPRIFFVFCKTTFAKFVFKTKKSPLMWVGKSFSLFWKSFMMRKKILNGIWRIY